MTCRDVLTPNPPVVHPEDTVRHAIDLLIAHRVLSLPVVDADGRYLGMFAKSRLFGLLLPAVVAAEGAMPHIAQLPDLDFLPDGVDHMRERLREIGTEPVGKYADRSVAVLRPESPLTEAVLLLFRTRNFIAVVEPGTERLLGVVSTWDTLAKLCEGV